MKLLFKQRLFSWLDSYDIYDENEQTVYVVKGQLAIGHCLNIFDATGDQLGTVRQKLLTWMPKYEIYEKEQYIGCISREAFSFRPRYDIDFNGWHIGLYHYRGKRRADRNDIQAAFSYDRYLRFGYCTGRRCLACPDVCACYRCGEMQ